MTWIVNPFKIEVGIRILTCTCNTGSWHKISGEGCLELDCGYVRCEYLQCGEPGTGSSFTCGNASCGGEGFKGKCYRTNNIP